MSTDLDYEEVIEEQADSLRKRHDLPGPSWVRTVAGYFEQLSYYAAWLGSLQILVITVLISFNVLSRKYYEGSITGSLELVEYSLVWITFISAAWVLRHDGHVKVDILILVLPRSVRYWFYYVGQALGGLVCAFLTFYSGNVVLTAFLRETKLINQLILPKWAVMVVIPIGFFMLALEFILLILRGPSQQFLEDNLT